MRRIVFENFRLKLLALVFSFALWFFVAGQSNTEVGFLVPLGFKSMPRDLVMTGTPPGEIEVRVMGPKLFINNLSPTQIIAELDLAGAKEGLNTYRLTIKDVITPMGVEVVKLRPNSVDIRMDRVVRVTLPVKPRLNGRPAPGYRVAGIVVTPSSVTATGVRKEIREIGFINTHPVDITRLSSSTTFTAGLEVTEQEFRSISDEKVSVRVLIERGN